MDESDFCNLLLSGVGYNNVDILVEYNNYKSVVKSTEREMRAMLFFMLTKWIRCIMLNINSMNKKSI